MLAALSHDAGYKMAEKKKIAQSKGDVPRQVVKKPTLSL